jgi:hypothetical protein
MSCGFTKLCEHRARPAALQNHVSAGSTYHETQMSYLNVFKADKNELIKAH